ncbi:MAG: hypothetical protein QGF36_04820 [Candidatus Marinimicrobia bacterium]|mgnify:CR=1 FL=1|nr:hypothetical protein [Candidatus Neomarinimicrobiota bacterium]MDP6853217.1 hypothetical protein [Candidatus Neomarinimicrobiota bacterium]MDP6936735.1 hypothetical protein [Candidatus Neomarinimicrobiota bacterium]
MKHSLSLPFVGFAILVLVLQTFIPGFSLGGEKIVPDLLLIFMVYAGLLYGRFSSILIGFGFGLVQDFASHFEIIGAMAFTKSLTGFGLGSLALYRTVWPPIIRALIVTSIFLLHFLLFFFIKFNGTPASTALLFQVAILHTLVGIIILWILDKAIIRNLFSR